MNTVAKINSRTAATKELIIATAEQLFANRGIDSVSLAEINVGAKQRNRNAVQYHFGSKDTLLQAIFDKHAPVVSQQRQHMLEALNKAPQCSLHDVVAALVKPVAMLLNNNNGGTAYIQINAQLATRNTLNSYELTDSSLKLNREPVLAKLFAQHLTHLAPQIIELRLTLAISLMFHSLGDLAAIRLEENHSRLFDNETLVINNLIDSISALLSAPVSAATTNALS